MQVLAQIWKIFYVNWIIFLRKKILIMRIFPILMWNSNQNAFPFFISLQTLILLPTRISNNSKTLTDDFFCNIPNTVVKVQSLQTSHQVYRFIFHIIFHYQNSFQIPLQLNITLYLMTWENLITSHFLKILKKLIGIKSFN